jgi:hypothetical protein
MPSSRYGAILLALFTACQSPSDIVSDPPSFTPLQDAEGRFRVTFGSGPDVARGFTPDGRLLFRAFDLDPFAAGWVLASVPPDGGVVREEAGVYRPAFVDPIATLVSDGSRRALVLWRAPIAGGHGCPDSSMTTFGNPGPAPRPPTPIELAIYSMPAEDVAISSLPVRSVSLSAAFLDFQGFENQVYTERRRVRVTPALRDVNHTTTDAFGPVMLPGTDEMVYSDGERLWRASMADTSVAPVSLGPGAYPALSWDGHSLAYARPWGVDSTMQLFTVPLTLGICYQTQIEILEGGWEVVVHDLATGADRWVADGLEPAWDPSGARLVVRDGSLKWFDLAAGTETIIAATEGAFAPAVAPDGGVLAFSRFTGETNADVYFLRLQ